MEGSGARRRVCYTQHLGALDGRHSDTPTPGTGRLVGEAAGTGLNVVLPQDHAKIGGSKGSRDGPGAAPTRR